MTPQSLAITALISYGAVCYPWSTFLVVSAWMIYVTTGWWYPHVYATYQSYLSVKLLLDPTNERGHLAVVCSLLLSLTKWGWTVVRARLHDSDRRPTPTRFNARYLKIPFTYRDRSYFYLLKIPRGVVPLQSIVNQDNVDVREEIEPYLGPHLDCFGATLTPADFGHKRLVFTTAMDRIVSVEEQDPIQLVLNTE